MFPYALCSHVHVNVALPTTRSEDNGSCIWEHNVYGNIIMGVQHYYMQRLLWALRRQWVACMGTSCVWEHFNGIATFATVARVRLLQRTMGRVYGTIIYMKTCMFERDIMYTAMCVWDHNVNVCKCCRERIIFRAQWGVCMGTSYVWEHNLYGNMYMGAQHYVCRNMYMGSQH